MKRRVSGLLAATAVVWACAAGAAEPLRLPPVDDGARDVTWSRFKTRLLEALHKRDRRALLAAVDTRIRNISGISGIGEFTKLWEPGSPDSALWKELPALLQLGAASVKREKGPAELCAPYVYYRWPETAFGDAVIVAREALLKASANSMSETHRELSYDIVKVLDWEVADDRKDNLQKWVRVQTDNVTGFVPEEQVRSPIEYRACFVRNGTTWRMTSFEVGE